MRSWKWISAETADEEALNQLKYREFWKQDIENGHRNQMHVQALKTGSEAVYGSLVYSVKGEDKEKVFHYYISKELLVTIGFPHSSLSRVNEGELEEKLNEADRAPEGFSVILHGLSKHYLDGIDEFEEKMNSVMEEVHRHNRASILNQIYDLRHSLLRWKGLLMKIIELKEGMDEAFLNDTETWTEYRRLTKQLNRAMTLLKEYEEEIDTIINMEEVISSNNGNEIMKSLTVITILFTPLTAWGALWGMNFEKMPELKWTFGYPAALLLIISTTIYVYWYMNSKGFMKDLLRRRK
ncbi:magnesium transporter CorA family protein [Metabacillus mangrovi]|nr:magnesium transporter CorA family protein [Metabacillus mangrovi]